MTTTRTHDPEAYRTTANIARELDVHPSAATRWINPEQVKLKKAEPDCPCGQSGLPEAGASSRLGSTSSWSG